jgi:exodeoxyribonuclease VII large subunit
VLPDLAALASASAARLGHAAAALRELLAAAERRHRAVDSRRALGDAVDRAASALEVSAARIRGRHPASRLPAAQSRLAAAAFKRPVWEILGRAEGRLSADLRHLRALSPERTLERGYAVVTRSGGTVVRDASQLGTGEAIRIRFAVGHADAEITATTPGSGVEDSG